MTSENTSAAPIHVFINCPYSDDYEREFNAIILTVLYFGFNPRSAMEDESSTLDRMSRIKGVLMESQYSVHDLSKIYADPATGVARMNMPLELGIAIGIGMLAANADDQGKTHRWIAHLPQDAKYRDAISDLNGSDLPHYDSREKLVFGLMKWLRKLPRCPRPDARPGPIWLLLDKYERRLSELKETEWRFGVPWDIRIDAARELVGDYLQEGSRARP